MAKRRPRWLRSARHRPAAFLTILLLSAGAVLVSAVLPMLVGAVQATSLRERVAAAPLPDDGVAVTAVVQPTGDLPTAESAVGYVLQAASASADVWGAPQQVDELQLVPRLFGPNRSPFPARLSIAPFLCKGMTFRGQCPTSSTDALLPASLARNTGWTVGAEVSERIPLSTTDTELTKIGGFTVVGVYDDTAGLGAALADPTRLQADTSARAVRNVVIGAIGVDAFDAPTQVIGAVRIAKPVTQADVAGLRAGVAAAREGGLGDAAAESSVIVVTRLDDLLDAIADQAAAADVLAVPTGVAAVVLAWFALGAVAQRTARSRAAEWGVGRMRGVRVRAWLGAVFTEPLIAILLGVLLGAVLALVVSWTAARMLLGSAADVAPLAPPVLGGVALAAAGSVLALTAASVRAAVLPLPQLLQDTAEPRQLTRGALVLQVALVSVAVAAVWAALTTTTFGGQQLGLLLPAMLALVAGIVAVRLTVLLVRRGSRRAPTSLGALLIVRGLARAPSVLVAGQLVLVSAALGASTLQLGLLSASAQADRARLALGAPRVLTVRAPSGASLLELVRRADPSGRTAMAAEQVVGVDGQAGSKVLAVDARRLAAVTGDRTRWAQGFDVRRLASDAEGLRLRGTSVTLDVADVQQDSIDPDAGGSDVHVRLLIARPSGWDSISLGSLADGRLRAAVPCSSGCDLVALQLRNGDLGGQPWTARFVLRSISTDLQPAASLRSWIGASHWRNRVVDEFDPTLPAGAGARDAGAGMLVRALDQAGGAVAQLEPAVGPDVVPAVTGEDASLVRFPGTREAVLGTSLAGTPILVRPVARVVAVPRALRTGVLVDLGTMRREEDPSLVRADQQVWLAATGQQRVLAALRREHVRIIGSERSSTAIATALASTTHRALLVAGVTAVVGLLFGLLALVAARVIDMPERRREHATLRLAGVSPRRLRRIAFAQTAMPGVLGAVVGVVAGSVAASLIGSRLPLLVGESPGPLLDTTVPLASLAALAGALVGLVLLAAAVVTGAEARGVGR